MPERSKGSTGRALGAAVVATLLATVSVATWPATTGCYTHQCDPVTVPPWTGGEMVDRDHYETNPIEVPDSGADAGEGWLSYPANVTLHITFPPSARCMIGTRRPSNISVLLGTTDQPDVPDASFIGSADYLAEFTNLTSEGFDVYNDSCANYVARFYVEFPSISANGAAPSMPCPVDAGASATVDAPAD